MKKGQVDFPPPSSSYAPEKTKGYLLKVVRLKGLKFSGGIEMELWGKMGWYFSEGFQYYLPIPAAFFVKPTLVGQV